jgi:hypothetical protein
MPVPVGWSFADSRLFPVWAFQALAPSIGWIFNESSANSGTQPKIDGAAVTATFK